MLTLVGYRPTFSLVGAFLVSERLIELVRPVVESLGCIFWGLEYYGGGSRHQATVRIYIDHAEGVNVDHCAQVSRQVSSVFDVEDPIRGEYTLEVSSPGLDRPLYTLEQYQQFVGEQVKVKLRAPFEGRRQFNGVLAGVEGDEVVVQVDDNDYLLPIESIDRANVVPTFEK